MPSVKHSSTQPHDPSVSILLSKGGDARCRAVSFWGTVSFRGTVRPGCPSEGWLRAFVGGFFRGNSRLSLATADIEE